MKRKILSLLILAIVIVPCMVLLSACKSDVVGFKVVINGRSFVSSVNTGITVEYGTDVKYDIYSVFENGEQEALGASSYTVTDESGVLTENLPVGTYTIKFSYGEYSDIKIDITIVPKEVAVPTIDDLTYNGQDQIALPVGYDADIFTVSNNTHKNAADYTATIALKDKVNYVWEDGTTTDKEVGFTIKKLALDKPVLESNELVFNLEAQNAPVSEYNTQFIEVVGDAKTNVGENYTVEVNLIDSNCEWKDGSTDSFNLVWKIVPLKIDKPFINDEADLVYNTQKQNAPIVGFNDAYLNYVDGSVFESTNAGEFDIVIEIDETLVGNVVWADETVADVELTWGIAKKVLAKPIKSEKAYSYNKAAQTLELVGFDDATMNVTGNTGTNAASYTAKVSLEDTVNYIWADQTSAEYDIAWEIAKARLAKPTKKAKLYTYSATEQTLELVGFDDATMNVTGNTGTNASDAYTATISLEDSANYCWADETIASFEIAWAIVKAQAEAPTVAGLEGTYAPTQKLASFDLPEFVSWIDDTIVPTCDVTSYAAKYNPDSANYIDAEFSIELVLAKAQAVAPAVEAMSGTYDPAKTLADYALPAGFTWANSTTKPVVKESVYAAKYNPDSVNYLDDEVNITLNIAKANPTAPAVNAFTAVYDEEATLADFELPAGFTWEDAETVPTVAVSTYEAIYNPDSENYNNANAQITINVSPKIIDTPTFAASLTYNGSDQTILPVGYESQDIYTISGNTKKNAGNHKAVVTIADSNYAFVGGVSSLELDWVIAKIELEKPDWVTRSFTYNKGEQSIELNDKFDDDLMNITGNKGTDADDYTAIVSIADKVNYSWDDGTDADIEFSWVIKKFKLMHPWAMEDEYTYTGEEISVELAETFDAEIMNITGNTGIDADTYTAIISIKDECKKNYTWINMQGEPIEDNAVIEWVINPAEVQVAFKDDLSKEYDGLAINNPHITLTGNVEYEYKFYEGTLDDSTSWVEKQRAEIVAPGQYVFVISSIDDSGNYINIENEAYAFTVGYNLEKMMVEIVDENQNENGDFYFTGSAITPDVYVIISATEDPESGDPIYNMLDAKYYEVLYYNNTLFCDGAYVLVRGKGACSGEVRVGFDILPGILISGAEVNNEALELSSDSNHPYDGADAEIMLETAPEEDFAIKLSFIDGYAGVANMFGYTAYGLNNDVVKITTAIENPTSFTVPKEARYIVIEYLEDNGYRQLTLSITVEEEIKTEDPDDGEEEHWEYDWYVSYEGYDYGFTISNGNKTITKDPGFTGDIVAILEAMFANGEAEEIDFDKPYINYGRGNCSKQSITLDGDTLTIVIYSGDEAKTRNLVYTVLDRPAYNSAYIDITPDETLKLNIDNYSNLIEILPGFTGDLASVLDAYITADLASDELWNVYIHNDAGSYIEGYTYDTVTAGDGIITIVLKKEGASDINLVYSVVDGTTKAYNFFNDFDIEFDNQVYMPYSNRIELRAGHDDTIDLATTIANAFTKAAAETFVNGAVYKSVSIADNIATITFTVAGTDYDLEFEVADNYSELHWYVSHIYANQYSVQFDIYNLTYMVYDPSLTLSKEFMDAIAINAQEYEKVTLLGATYEGDIITITIGYKVDEETTVQYSFDFTKQTQSSGGGVPSDVIAELERIEMSKFGDFDKLLTLGADNTIVITETMTIAHAIEFTFTAELRDFTIMFGEEDVTELVMSSGFNFDGGASMYSSRYIDFIAVSGEGTYTIIVNTGVEETEVYTIKVESYDDTQLFEFTHGGKDYTFSMDMMGEIKMAFDIMTESPSSMYVYLGDVEGNTITINAASLIDDVYYMDRVTKIENFNSITLPVVEKLTGERYALIYAHYNEYVIPVYFYLYDAPAIKEGSEIEFTLGDKVLNFSSTPVEVTEGDAPGTYYGDFVMMDENVVYVQLTKSEIGYIEGDTTVASEFKFASMSYIVIYDAMRQKYVFAMGDHVGEYHTPIMIEVVGEAPEQTTITAITLAVVSIDSGDMMSIVVMIVDDAPMAPVE